MPRLASVPLKNTGLEFAQMYRRFGSEVTVIELARAHIMPRHVRSDLGKPSSWLCAMRSRLSVWRLDADEVHVLQEAVETGDTQGSDLDVKRKA